MTKILTTGQNSRGTKVIPFCFASTYIPLVILLAVAIGCAPKGNALSEESAKREFRVEIRPVELSAEPDDKRMTVQWKRQGEGLFSGYNVYICEQPLSVSQATSGAADTLAPFNLSPFPGDTDPTDGVETFEADGLENGRKYFVSARVIYPDRTLSSPSNEVMIVCGPRGEVTLDARFAGENDGYSLENGQFVRADSPDNDLYFYHKDGTDYLASPSRLGGYTHVTGFAKLSYQGGLEGLRRSLPKGAPNATFDRIAVQRNDWILLRRSDDTYAVVNVRGFDGTARERQIAIFFAYCPLKGELLF